MSFYHQLTKKIETIQKLMDSEKLQPTLNQAINWIIEISSLGRFLPICSIGCLAADTRKISGELIGKFFKELRDLNMIFLNANVSILTAWANEYVYNSAFSRQLEAHVYAGVSGPAGILQMCYMLYKKGSK